ncbi:probable G-protein coupled receptor 148 [Spea bombifrons]|uniref:probable G-protein coupled receptor 148 n=1 Tax=Spea bombifrons TaxID=233779 RepID=UPI0023490890|nr:probable G-protein coupled receptor 148 [Spea bombifrons]
MKAMNSSECSLLRIVNATIMLQRESQSNRTLFMDKSAQYMLKEWIIYPSYVEMKMFLIPTLVCFGIAICATPFILFAIFSNVSIRQETRFLLLGNALVCDLIYLIFYTITTICNVMSLKIPKHVCVLCLFLLAVTYSGGVLTAAAMVADTYLAVLWPLHYVSLLPAQRAKKLLMLLWLSSFFFPAIVFLSLHFTQSPGPCPLEFCSLPLILVKTLHGDDALKLCYILFVTIFLICFTLILCCYVVLCYKTRETGIWKGVSSRASITFLMHHVILFFYFSPLLILLAESLLYMGHNIGLRTGLWVTMTTCNVLIVLPKAASPCLYGLRYREIYKSLRLFFRLKKHRLVAPVMSS